MADTNETKVKKSKKVKKDENTEKFKILKKSGPTANIAKWPLYIYKSMKEHAPHLLLREDVRIAYNNFINCILKYQDSLRTLGKHSYDKYDYGFKINERTEDYKKGLPFTFTYAWDARRDTNLKNKLDIESKDIIDTFRILYELIKKDIMPHVYLKHTEEYNKTLKAQYFKDIERYELAIKNKETKIKEIEENILQCRKIIVEHINKIKDLDLPPKVPSFD
jgi:hypothetical protein